MLLYELLTGTTPLDKRRVKEAAWDELRRIIREEEPPRPSKRLSTTKTLPSLAAGVVACSVVVWLLLGLLSPQRAERFAGRLERLPRVGGSAAEFWRAVWMYRCRQASVALTLLLSWVGHVGFVVGFYCCARTLWDGQGAGIPTLPQHFLLVPIGLVVQALVPLPGGMGAGEWGFGALYQLFNCARSSGILGSLVLRVLTWAIGLLGLAVFLAVKSELPRPDASECKPEPATAAV